VETASGIKRRGAGSALSDATVQVVFKTAKGAAASAEGKEPAEQIVFRVTDVTTPPFDPEAEQAKAMRDQLRNAMSDELLNQFVEQIGKDVGATLNLAAMRQAVSAGGGQ
jgi:peptidyl-prolyl cis-trans isomerase D